MISLLAKARTDGIKKKKGGKMLDYYMQKSRMIQQLMKAWGCTSTASDCKPQQSTATDASWKQNYSTTLQPLVTHFVNGVEGMFKCRVKISNTTAIQKVLDMPPGFL